MMTTRIENDSRGHVRLTSKEYKINVSFSWCVRASGVMDSECRLSGLGPENKY